jgi:hypothetical protein
MAKIKHVTRPAPAPAAPASQPVAVQLMTVLAQVVVIGVLAVGVATVATWTLDGAGVRVTRSARQPAPPRGAWVHCWRDPRYGEMCEPAGRWGPTPQPYPDYPRRVRFSS